MRKALNTFESVPAHKHFGKGRGKGIKTLADP
jgi:hypothetical protein